MRRIFVTSQFERDLQDVPSAIRERADRVLQILAADTQTDSLNIKKLTNIRPPVWRVRIGDYRLVYNVTKTSIVLHRIRHRKDIYRSLKSG